MPRLRNLPQASRALLNLSTRVVDEADRPLSQYPRFNLMNEYRGDIEDKPPGRILRSGICPEAGMCE